jgi:acyl-CoA reductase-like NAD-dependent aldehyde dehydrogenase
MRIGREEIFGPVMAMAPWSSTDEVIAAANDTELGLTACVWTESLSTAHRVADRLQAGYVWVNDTARHYWGTPFGGQKNSGLGREESTEEYEGYMELKAVHVILLDPPADRPQTD